MPLTKEQPIPELTNNANYSDAEMIGSNHWFNTLIGQVKRIGEYMSRNEIDAMLTKEYGKVIENIATDLYNWKAWCHYYNQKNIQKQQ